MQLTPKAFARVNRALVAYFLRRVPEQEPNDLAAETWLGVVRWYAGRCSLRGFAFLVAEKIIVDVLYRKRRLRTLELRDGDEPVASGPSPYDVLRLVADHDALDSAVGQVDEVYREVVRLSLIGRGNVQIAAELEVPYNTVRSRLWRGRAQVLGAARAEIGVE
ncbi:hypothetical protein DB30_01230 [Enhygromyxa salina]|uniref:RNA polymerase sigma factor 70 region 4 type 2 domain-containing protein n=1 Tax=Enhygromyxa salina TaxID=215803 RepID=A0A0C2CXL3_9BACT|nr:hypothetical protein DB30_01230 [Enhygromyxa salina]